MTIADLAKDSLSFLILLLQEAYEDSKGNENVRSAFIYRHARNIADIADDMFFLYDHGRYTLSGLGLRSMLESQFCIAASLHRKDFPAEKIIAECEKWAGRLGKTVFPLGGADITDTVSGLSELAAKLRADFSIVSKKPWNTFEVAQAAKLEQIYNSEYAYLCNFVHSNTSAIMSQESGIGVGLAVQVAMGTVIGTAGYIAMTLQTKTPQEHVDKASKLLQRLLEMDKAFDHLEGKRKA